MCFQNEGLPDTFIRPKPNMSGVKSESSISEEMTQMLQALGRGRGMGIGRGVPLESLRPGNRHNGGTSNIISCKNVKM